MRIKTWPTCIVAMMTMNACPLFAQTITYIHTDHLGSPIVTTNNVGQVVWSATRSSFGDIEATSGQSTHAPVGYTGGSKDILTGLIYLKNRYYDASIGRFISVDPMRFNAANPALFNRYVYANNNPLKFVDPDGAQAEFAFERQLEIQRRLALGQSDSEAAGGTFFTGAASYFRGLARFTRHQSRLHGNYGMGEQIQAAHVEHMLFGEAIQLVLHANQTMIKEGAGVATSDPARIVGRFGSGILAGQSLGGGGAGPSLGLLAAMGDIYHHIEVLAKEARIFMGENLDPTQPILPQLPAELRDRITKELQRIIEIGITGDRSLPEPPQ